MAFVLKPGSSGQAVFTLQQRLVDIGALKATAADGSSNVDGRFGQVTRQAVIDLQNKHGLYPDGLVGPNTAAALDLPAPEPQAEPKAKHIFTAAQLKKLAELVDGLLPTGPLDLFDDRAIAWLVEKLDGALAKLLPPHVLAFINDISQGLDGDLAAVKRRLSEQLNRAINVPLLSEETEGRIIATFVDLVFDALQLGSGFDAALARIAPKATRTV